AILRLVRRTINEFRDENWDGLARTRALFLMIVLSITLATYGLVLLAIAAGVPAYVMGAAMAYFLVGAVVGLVSRFQSLRQQETTVDDFGLSRDRLTWMPLLSGWAAVGGVVLAAMISPQLAGVPQLPSSPQPDPGTLKVTLPILPVVFNVLLHP